MRHRQRGFTLFELMVVVAIIALLATLLIGVSSRTYGANAYNVSEQIASTMNFAKMRAVATRRIHTVQIKPREILIWQSDITGFRVSTGDPEFVQRVSIPAGVVIWDVEAAVRTTTPNAVTQNAALVYDMLFKPDGSSTGGTIYVTDTQRSRELRVLVYRATGSSHARQVW